MTKDMTSGAITPLLIKFTIPLVLGNLFQLTYNAADSIIVGKFVGEDALAAVGTSNPLMTLPSCSSTGCVWARAFWSAPPLARGDTKRGGAAGIHHCHCGHGVLFDLLCPVRAAGRPAAAAAAGACGYSAHCGELSAHRVLRD